MTNKELVSVVVPIYNVEKYVEKCIKSIMSQTYKSIEILLVNDGSTDKSLEICERIQKKDSRIKIFSQENKGLSEARNTGIRNAKGEFICFVDSDDYIHKNFIKLLIKDIIKNSADISVCDYMYTDEEENFWSNREKSNKIFSNIEAIKDIFIGKQETEVVAWNKLYRLSLFKENNIYFPKGKYHEDKFTTYKLYYFANKISLIKDKLYYYLQRSNSIMGCKFNVRRLDALEAVEDSIKFFDDKKINFKEELDAYEANMYTYMLNNIIRSGFEGKEKKQIIQKIKKKKKIYLKNKFICKKTKLSIFVLFGNGILYKILFLMYDHKKRK